MNVAKFEDIVQRKGMRIEQKVKAGEKIIFLCEGYSRGDRDSACPHYKTMFAIAGDADHVTVGEFFTTDIIFPMISKVERLKSAEERARQFLTDLETECPA